jgi:hypothetical protein
MLKEVLKVCRRGQRQYMYTASADVHDLEIQSVMSHTRITTEVLRQERRKSDVYIFESTRPNLLEESENDLMPPKRKLAWGSLGKMWKFKNSFTSFAMGVKMLKFKNSFTGAVVKEDTNP